jgi:lipopolysaccharide transport system ATP-binding protein
MSIVISVEHLSKTYRLGQISTGTFTYDLAVWWAKLRGKPNPTLRIGETDYGNRDGKEFDIIGRNETETWITVWGQLT